MIQAGDTGGRGHLCTWIRRRNEAFEKMVAWGGPHAGAMTKKKEKERKKKWLKKESALH